MIHAVRPGLPKPSSNSNLPSLTSLRWYAALLVFFFHVSRSTPFHWVLLNPLQFGYVGVTFFFVLSGFVLTWSLRPGVSAGQFYWRRFARIYPAHLAMFLVVGLIVFLVPGLFPVNLPGAIASITLTQSWTPGRVAGTWNSVSWSLSDEAFFYLCFPALLHWMRRSSARTTGVLVCAAITASLVVSAFMRYRYGYSGPQDYLYFNPLSRLPEFMLGVWLGTMARAGRLNWRPTLWLPVAFAVALGALSWRKGLPYYPLADYLMIPGFAVLILVAANRDAAQDVGLLDRVLRHPVSVYLGTVSYAFYLVHLVVIDALEHVTGWRHPWSSAAGAGPVAAMFAVSLAAAIGLHHTIEKPAQRWLTRKFQVKPSPHTKSALVR